MTIEEIEKEYGKVEKVNLYEDVLQNKISVSDKLIKKDKIDKQSNNSNDEDVANKVEIMNIYDNDFTVYSDLNQYSSGWEALKGIGIDETKINNLVEAIGKREIKLKSKKNSFRPKL